MICRKKEYKVGDKVTVAHCWGGYRLPIELPDGATVEILERDETQAVVKYEGKQFLISTACVESGWEYRFMGKWLDEADPIIIQETRNKRFKK